MTILSRQQIREVDRRATQEYGMSGLVLMENAGRGVAEVVRDLCCEGRAESWGGPVAIVCGKGNNGGDGIVVARHLDLRKFDVKVLLLAKPAELTGDAAANFSIIEKADLPIVVFQSPLDQQRFDAELVGCKVLVDAILGTGATGEPKSPYAEAIDHMNGSGIPIVAVDIPSGLDCDTGVAARHTVRAAHTCTFVAGKPGLFADDAKQYVGNIYVLGIGAPRRLIEEIAAGQ